jgi:hypothetical protein
MYRAMHVHVTQEQYAYLRRARARTGHTMARLVRHALDQTYGTGHDPGHGPGHPQRHDHWVTRLAEAVARRTRLSADTLKTLVGAYVLVSRIRSFVKMAQRARRADR